MFSDYFLALLFAHLAGDFVFQNDWLCKMKVNSEKSILGGSIHTGIILVINVGVFILFFKNVPWIVVSFLSLFHWIIDFFKSKFTMKFSKKSNDINSVIKENVLKTSIIEKTSVIETQSYDSTLGTTSKRELDSKKITEKISNKSTSTDSDGSKEETNRWNVPLFFGDQAIHLVSILIAANILHRFEFGHYVNFYHQFVSGTVTLSNSLTAIKKELLVLIYLCLATSVSNIVIKTLVGGLKKDLGSDSRPGRYIGGVERILTIAIILAGAWQALAVLYGSKTAIRFEKAKEEPEFAEYYILGTSLSALFGVLIAVAAKITLF